MNKKNYFFSFIIMLIFLFFAGCATIQGLYVDPSFTFVSIASNNIGVGGVVSSSRNLKPSQQTAASNLLQSAIIQRYPGLSIMPAGDTVRALGVARYRAMMQYYQQNGVVPNQYLSALSQHISHMRYIAFARIEQDQISHDRGEYENNDDIYGSGTANIVYSTRLTLRVQLDVYDLSTQTIVWRGSLSESDSRDNNYTVPSMSINAYDSTGRIIAKETMGIAGSAIVARNHAYPSPPSFSNLLQSMFIQLVKKFPNLQED